MNKSDAYNIMGLSFDASKNEVKHKYRELAKKYHPDINNNKDSISKFIEVSEAYEFLSNNRKKASHFNKENKNNTKRTQNYRPYNYEDQKNRFERANDIFNKEFSKQSNELYERLFYKYRNSNQRKIAIIFSVLGLIVSALFTYDTLSSHIDIPISINTNTENSINIYQKMDGDIIANYKGTEYIITDKEYYLIKKYNHISTVQKIAFIRKTRLFKNGVALKIVNPENEQQYICKTNNANINQWLLLIIILMAFPSLSFIWEKPTFNFVFFAINYNLYGFPTSLFLIILYATPIIG